MAELSEKGNVTRARIVETARELFHKNGVRATSIDQILEASGTGKSQFYHYFNSKEDIVHEVLKFYMRITQSGQGPVRVHIESWEDLERFFYDHVEGLRMLGFERSCPVGSIGNELASENEQVRVDVNMIFDYMRKNIAGFLKGLKSEGRLSKSADPDTLADFSIASVQGALLLAKVRKDGAPAENTVRHALAYLKSFAK